MTLEPQDLTPLQFALPESLEVPPDTLKLRLDFYSETIVLHLIEDGVVTNRTVSAVDIAAAMSRELTFSSDLLPPDALWWSHSRQGNIVALWRKPQVTRVAIQVKAFEAPVRYQIPMPGLVFLCQAGRTPSVFAAKRRPRDKDAELFHCPTFNVFSSGSVCPGTHRFPTDVTSIPESFFQSLFALTGDAHGRSVKHRSNLLKLWEELDGQKKYPLDDLVSWGFVDRLMNGNEATRRNW